MPDDTGSAPLGVLGGTFDPIHFGHLRLAEEAFDRLGLSGISWLPAGRPALRRAPQAAAADRLAMVRLATGDNARFAVDASEVTADSPSYTVPTLERLRDEERPGMRRPLVLLVGADAFSALPAWHRWQQLFELAHIAVAHRPGVSVDTRNLPQPLAAEYHRRICLTPQELTASPSGRIISLAMTPLAISATQIRALLAARRSPRYLLPDAVIAYIDSRHLYTGH